MTIEFENDTCVMDHNGNKANFGEGKKFVDKQAAIASLETNKGCTNCTDCVECTKCNHMVNCDNCANCAFCKDCTDCANCTHCSGCDGDSNCDAEIKEGS